MNKDEEFQKLCKIPKMTDLLRLIESNEDSELVKKLSTHYGDDPEAYVLVQRWNAIVSRIQKEIGS